MPVLQNLPIGATLKAHTTRDIVEDADYFGTRRRYDDNAIYHAAHNPLNQVKDCFPEYFRERLCHAVTLARPCSP
jgi:hypothetical protein